jgi:hypothetical protein
MQLPDLGAENDRSLGFSSGSRPSIEALVTKLGAKLEESLKFLHISKRIVQSKDSSQSYIDLDALQMAISYFASLFNNFFIICG